MKLGRTTVRNFWSNVEKSDGCWEWQGCLSAGYGNMHQDRAHRVSWIIHYGDIPDGLHVCHKCDNRSCVNPKHLFLATNQQNMMDAACKGVRFRARSFSEEDAERIRKIYLTENISQRQLAEEFGTSEGTIWNIVGRRGFYA